MKRILSIDVGIKNLSYCYLETSKENTRVLAWDNVSVTEHVKNTKLEELTELMLTKLNDTFDSDFYADVVIIENQPMLKNGMMKTISVVIYTYFHLLKLQYGTIKDVRFISATNKLKCKKVKEIESADTSTYKDRKKLSVDVTKKYILSICPEKEEWFMSIKKKDDAADSLLLGVYYIEFVLGWNLTTSQAHAVQKEE